MGVPRHVVRGSGHVLGITRVLYATPAELACCNGPRVISAQLINKIHQLNEKQGQTHPPILFKYGLGLQCGEHTFWASIGATPALLRTQL